MFFYGFVLMVFVHWIPVFETVQETLDRLRYRWKTLADLCGLLDSCFRDCARNPR